VLRSVVVSKFPPVAHAHPAKTRLGEQHYRRVFDTPTPPFERLCEIEALPRKVLSRLQTLRRQTNPIQLRQQIAALIEQLWAVPVCPAR